MNLAIFTTAAIFVLRKKINEALLARRDAIQQEIISAQQERERALARVAEADNLLSQARGRRACGSANKPTKRRSRSANVWLQRTEREMEKLKQQSQREIETADKLARKELRQFLATEKH